MIVAYSQYEPCLNHILSYCFVSLNKTVWTYKHYKHMNILMLYNSSVYGSDACVMGDLINQQCLNLRFSCAVILVIFRCLVMCKLSLIVRLKTSQNNHTHDSHCVSFPQIAVDLSHNPHVDIVVQDLQNQQRLCNYRIFFFFTLEQASTAKFLEFWPCLGSLRLEVN